VARRGFELSDAVGVISGLARILLPLLIPRLSRVDYSEKRLATLKELMESFSPGHSPEHHSLVGYFVSLGKGDENALAFIKAAREKFKEFVRAGELEEIEYDEFKRRFGEEIYPPALVIWSTELKKPLLTIPFYYHERKGEVKARPATKEVGELLSEEIKEEEEKEKEFVEV